MLQMTGFRSLGDDEVVEYKAVNSDKGHEATAVRAVGGGDCQGSHRRPGAKKKTKKVRYNIRLNCTTNFILLDKQISCVMFSDLRNLPGWGSNSR